MQKDSAMLEFEISHDEKPLIYITGINKVSTSCLIDTGANLPVWFIGGDYLKYRYPESYPTDYTTIINGLGDRPLYDVPIWVIPEFCICDDKGNKVTYRNLQMAVLESARYSFDMIIPLTMLNRFDISFRYTESALYGKLYIETDRDVFYVRPIFLDDRKSCLNKIQVFAES